MDLSRLTTERRNPASAHIDNCTTLEMVTIMQQEDSKIAAAIQKILPDIARAIDETSLRLQEGGRLFYLGAGTSGRLGILDASECPPTYGTNPELVQGLIAGGIPAIFRAQEGAEDNPGLAVHDLKEHGFSAKDVLVGIAASGRTPYVVGGLQYAQKIGALTIALACSEHAEIAALADIALTPVTGPEVVTGSTRMKAGTAQKLVLNMLSTGTMIKLGKVYGNLMVDVKALKGADGHAKLAILMVVTGVSAGEGKALLERTSGHLAAAIRLAAGGVKA